MQINTLSLNTLKNYRLIASSPQRHNITNFSITSAI